MKQTLIFDLDGTLIDSIAGIHQAVTLMLQDFQQPPVSLEKVRSFVGSGLDHFFSSLMKEVNLDTVEDHTPYRKSLFQYLNGHADILALTKAWPGVPQTLKTLQEQGYRMGICTNKSQNMTLALLDDLSLSPFFDAVIGGDVLPDNVRKPDPRHITAVAEKMNADPKQAVMIGDHRNDVLPAIKLGIPAIMCRYGYGEEECYSLKVAASIDHFYDLPEVLKTIS